MVELLRKLETLKERGLINTDDVIKLRGNIQRNRLSASLVMNLIIKMSDEIEELKNKLNSPPKILNLEKVKQEDLERFIEMMKESKVMPIIENFDAHIEVNKDKQQESKPKSKSKEL